MYGNKVRKFAKKSIIVFMIMFLLFSLMVKVKATFDPNQVTIVMEKKISEEIKEYIMTYAIILILVIIDLVFIYIIKHSFKINNRLLKFMQIVEVILIVLPILMLVISILIDDIEIYDIMNISDVYYKVPISLIIIKILELVKILFSVVNFAIFIKYSSRLGKNEK